MDTTLSVSFIEEKGTELERARMRWVLHGVAPEPAIVRPYLELQNEDGGFPCRRVKGNPSCVHDTLNALRLMDELGLLETRAAEKAFGYLFVVQRDDGGWDEDPSAAEYGAPPWASPGDLRARLYLSAYTAYRLAIGGHTGHQTFGDALAFLLRHQDETGKFYGYLHSTWIATSVFVMAGDQYAEVARKGLQVLMSRSLPEWVDSQICWALNCLSRAGVPKDHPFIEACLTELRRRQGPHGEWSSEDGEAQAVGATIEALKVFKQYGLLETG